MRKTWFRGIALVSLAFSLLAGNAIIASAEPNMTPDGNYLGVGKNYYRDNSITKGFLDTVITENVDKLKQSADAGKIVFTEGMTYNDFFLANNLSPEDNYSGYKKKRNAMGNLINTNPNKYGELTYVGPAAKQQLAISEEPWKIAGPLLFSRLTVGDLQLVDGEKDYTFGKYTESKFPDLIGYGESNTVNDYMLTPENKIVIPTRFNTKRDDIWLTMRGNIEWGMRGVQAYLTAINEKDGLKVPSKNEDSKFYINTTSKILLTPAGYDALGFRGRLLFKGNIRSVNKQLENLGVNDFATTMNMGLRKLQDMSNAKNVPQGFGGQIQLTGFYRKTDIDNAYNASEDARVKDHKNTINATYFMYSSGDAIKGADNPEFPDVPEEYHANIPNLDKTKTLKMYSPNASVYKMVTTRPIFSNFGDLEETIKYQDVETDFAKKLGNESFNIVEDGVGKDGMPLSSDKNRVRFRVSVKGTVGAEEYTIPDFEKALKEGKYSGEIKAIYTYAGVDATDEILGKLPSEISDEQGAYAVPIVRKIKLPVTVTFDKNYGSDNNVLSSIKLEKNTELGVKNIPLNPTRDGYIFRGWGIKNDTLPADVLTLKGTELITDNTTYYAIWEKKPDSGKPLEPVVPVKPTDSDKGKTDKGKVILVKKPSLVNTGIGNTTGIIIAILSLLAVGIVAIVLKKKKK